MRARRAVAIAGLIATGCGDGGGGGCRFEDQSLIVSHVAVADAREEGCTWDPEGESLLRGTFYVGGGTAYLLSPVLVNNLASSTREGSNTGIEDGDLQLASPVDVTLRLPPEIRDRLDVDLSLPVSVATLTLAPESSTVVGIEAVPADLAAAISNAMEPGEQAELIVEVVFRATRTANSRGNVGVIESPPFEFPVTLINGFVVGGCECDGGACIPGSEVPAVVCGYAQDVGGTPFACEEDPEAAGSEESSIAPPELSSSSDGTASTGGA